MIDEDEREIDRLYDAIMAKDRTAALESFRELFPHHPNRSVEQQRNIFPERVPE